MATALILANDLMQLLQLLRMLPVEAAAERPGSLLNFI